MPCESHEQGGTHYHAHLAVYVNGQPASIPEGIGVRDPQVQQTADGPYVGNGSCFFWLHSHTADGLIHVESPQPRTFTLGDYFDIWGKPLSSRQVGDATGPVSAYVNGQRATGDPRAIAITTHAVIQLDVGQDVTPAPYTFPPGV